MSAHTCRRPLEHRLLVDYLLGELSPEEDARVEEHLFACAACTTRIEAVQAIGTSTGEIVREGLVAASVTEAVIEQAIRDGLSIRQYRIAPGETVQCAAGPEDFVAVRLSGQFHEAGDLTMDVDFHDLEKGEHAPPFSRPVLADRTRREIVLLFPGSVVRTYPRSIWTMRVRGESESGQTDVGTFVMDHTPASKR